MSRASRQQDGLFQFFNEVGIINQLASALFTRHLPAGVHVSHFAIVNHMVRMGDGRTPLQLARAMQVTKATMSHSLTVLQGRGFIRVEPHPEDGRAKVVVLTDAGRAFRSEAIEQLEAAMRPIARDADLAGVASAMPVLRQIRTLLDKERDVIDQLK